MLDLGAFGQIWIFFGFLGFEFLVVLGVVGHAGFRVGPYGFI
jgi:hypothetical protein